MITNITQNHLLLYAYNELEPNDHLMVEAALQADPVLASQYAEMSELLLLMDSLEYKPHPTSLQIILEESSSALELH